MALIWNTQIMILIIYFFRKMPMEINISFLKVE